MAESWPEADRLFHRDPRWLGGDDAYSIDLGNKRLLWLFGDTFIATTDACVRNQAIIIRNSVAIQEGYNPSSASIKFYWSTQNGNPGSFFHDSEGIWFWPGHGIRIGKKLLVFLMKMQHINMGLGFEALGWAAVLIDNPNAEPTEWSMRMLNTPDNEFGAIVGSASVFRVDDYIYAFSPDGTKAHNVYLVRWPIDEVLQGDLMIPQWWTGEIGGWTEQGRISEKPYALFSEAQTEFTVHYEPNVKRYIQVQTEGFGATNIALRWADRLEGPWSPLKTFYRPKESARPDAFVYVGKAHPELVGADLILTYVSSSLDGLKTLIADTSLYYPKFLKGTLKCLN